MSSLFLNLHDALKYVDLLRNQGRDIDECYRTDAGELNPNLLHLERSHIWM